MQYCLVYITSEDETEAGEIARALVSERLAACVNIHPIRSVFRWEGKVEESAEFALLVKTRTELVDTIIKRVKELHSYEVPCVLSIPIDGGNPDFLQWLGESTEGEV